MGRRRGSRFPLGCLGSGAFAGLNGLAEIDALCDEDGVTFAQARDAADGLLPDVPVRDGFPAPAGYVELHIEQGPVLEHRAYGSGSSPRSRGRRVSTSTCSAKAAMPGPCRWNCAATL